MVNLWFTEKDLQYRWAEVKRIWWTSFERRVQWTAKRLLEESLKVEQAASLGAGRYQRNRQRRDWRNGYYCRDVIWKLGVLSRVCVPRSRQGIYQSRILARYRRFGGEFDRHVLQLFTLGLSTRRVERFFTDLFGPCGLGAQTVSDILGRVSGELAAYRQGPLADTARYLYLDAMWVTIRGAFRQKYAVLFALTEDAQGRREIVDFQVATSEKAIHWQAFLDRLYRRGLRGKQLRLVITDGAAGLIDAVRTVCGFAPIQVCWVHRQRNLVARLAHRKHRRAISADAAAIFQAETKEQALMRLHAFRRRWQPKEPRAVNNFLNDIDLSLTFYNQPKQNWSRLASTNLLERQLREIRRRIRLIDSFRNEQSCERIIYTQVKFLNQKTRVGP